MSQSCGQCAQPFQVSPEDLNFYDKISPVFNGKKYSIPAPTLCPECRKQRRLVFRNERNLYTRTCDATKKTIASIYSPDKPYKVYDQTFWLGNEWEAMDYAQDLNLSRPFFDQFKELMLAVPHPAAGFRSDCENCDYTTYQNNSKNCYLTFGSGWMEDCAYCNWTYYAKDSFDCLGSNHLELCYDQVDCDKMYNCVSCQDCSNLIDSSHCYDCHSCENCFGCVGLVRKKFCFLNEQLTESEYKEKIKNLDPQKFLQEYASLKAKTPHRANFQLNCENCTGNHLINCKNVKDSFQATDSQDCRWNEDIVENKDCYDSNRSGLIELGYEIAGGGWYYKTLCSITSMKLNESFYSLSCFNSKHLFGCVGLKNKQYCILNKQYTKEEYEKLVPQIIEHMDSWGEFFPTNLSPFAYNETLANDFSPLTKEQVLRQNYRWKDADPKEYLPPTKEILACASCGRNYKIIPVEQKFYQKLSLPIPQNCPDCRLKKRLSMRNPRKLYDRTCAKCNAPVQTPFAPDRPEIVYCESCYLKEVY